MENYETRAESVLSTGTGQLLSCGTTGCGLETMTEGWESLRHAFSVEALESSTADCRYPGSRPPRDLLKRHLVDLLVLNRSFITRRPEV